MFFKNKAVFSILLGALAITGSAYATDPVKVLYFTKSQGYIHPAIVQKNGKPSMSENILAKLGKQYGFEITTTKDGGVFDNDYKQYDVIMFYTTGELTKPARDDSPVMSAQGKDNLLNAISQGTGFIGLHSASDTFHGKAGPHRFINQETPDPYIQMLGGEFIRHGAQQSAAVTVNDHSFLGTANFPKRFEMKEEWYALKNFSPDIHVIMTMDTSTMANSGRDIVYKRPEYPVTWARMHEKGRVFYTALGHRSDVWTSPMYQDLLGNAILWAGKKKEGIKLIKNLSNAAPNAHQLPNKDDVIANFIKNK
jgi:type 1 glutamine amidotransferase